MAHDPNFVFTYPHSDADIEDLFLKAMMSEGLIFDSKDLPLRLDGKTHYVKVANRSPKNKNSKSGWYNGRLGDFPCGRFGWLHGTKSDFSWSLYRHIKENEGGIKFHAITQEEAEERLAKREQEEKQRKLEEKKRFEFSKALTIIEWERSLPLTNHPYIHSKQFNINECKDFIRIYNQKNYTPKECEEILREHHPKFNKPSNIKRLMSYQSEHITFRGFNLIIKGQLIDETPLMFQLIFNKKNASGKNKHFPKSLIKQNTFLNLGKKLSKDTKKVIICEGVATGISITRFTKGKIPILVAWDSGNMQSVAIQVRRYIWDCKIYSASDNDHTSSKDKNAGLHSAHKVCGSIGAFVLMPPFNSNDPKQANLSDWNDIDMLYGTTEAEKIFIDCAIKAEEIKAKFDTDIQLLTPKDPINRRAEDALIHGYDFMHFWVSISELVFNGLQPCEFEPSHQYELLDTQSKKVEEELRSLNLYNVQQNYDPIINKQLSELFFNFNNAIHSSSGNIIHQKQIFQPTLLKLKALQPIINNISLITLMRECMVGKFGDELASACLALHIHQTNYFDRTTSEWHQAIGKKLCQLNIDISLALHPILQSKEFDYWDVPHKLDREDKAVAKILSFVEKSKESNNPLTQPTTEQQRKLQYIFAAQHQHLLTNNDKNYLNRLINKFNETEYQPININLFYVESC